jgi:transcriptional regulator with XRE-family HTH domain
VEIGSLITRAREAAGLSKRALARRSGTSPAAIVEYESGRRDPNARTLARVLNAAGAELRVVVPDTDGTAAQRGAILSEVLELAEHLPTRPAPRQLPYPKLPT